MEPLARRKFISMAAVSGAGLASLNAHDRLARSAEGPAAIGGAIEHFAARDGNHMAEEMKKEKVRLAMLAGPSFVTSEATVAEMDRQGNMTVLRPGTNDWVCIPSNQNVVGWPHMAIDPMVWCGSRIFLPESQSQLRRPRA